MQNSPLLKELSNEPFTKDVERAWAREVQNYVPEKKPFHEKMNACENGTWAVTKFLLTIFGAAAVLAMAYAHTASVIKASVAHASTDNTHAVFEIVSYDRSIFGETVSFWAAPGFPCNPEFGKCYSSYFYRDVPVDQAFEIAMQAAAYARSETVVNNAR